jgi:hypothetical protein
MMTHNLQEKTAKNKLIEILVADEQNDLQSEGETRPHEDEQGKS